MPEEIEEQHAIPQDISSYQFRLVGDMTLKQFTQVAAGILFALLLYASPLHPAIKWPLMAISALFGVALAFMPIEDRPLGKWILVFFRSIYSPTIFLWKKFKVYPTFFQPEGAKIPTEPVLEKVPAEKEDDVGLSPEIIAGTVYFSEQEAAALKKLERKEKTFLSRVAHLFSLSTLMGKPSVAQTPAPQSQKVEVPGPVTVTVVPEEGKEEAKKPTPELAPDETEKLLEELTAPVAPTLGQQTQITGQLAKFSPAAAPPIPPTRENIITGQTLTPGGKIIEGAILEIKDEEGRSVRALKTNKLGHFMIVTPLLGGKYEIITEKEGFNFEPVTLQAEGKIIPPIAIWAKEKT